MIEVRTWAFIVSVIIWLFIIIRYLIPFYRIEGKYDIGGLAGILIVLTGLGIAITSLFVELFFRTCESLQR